MQSNVDSQTGPEQRQLSPDGRFSWDGERWVPMATQHWEYAWFEFQGAKRGDRRQVIFSDGRVIANIGTSSPEIMGVLGALGADGWELVGHDHVAGTYANNWWFKRLAR